MNTKAEIEIKTMVGRVVQLNNEDDLTECCNDFNQLLREIAAGGSFEVVLCDRNSGGYGLCMEKNGSGSVYKITFECLNEAVCFFTNEFLSVEYRLFTENTSMRMESIPNSYIDKGYILHFENDTKTH